MQHKEKYMIHIGKINSLTCVKKVDFGAYFDGESFGEILLPKRYEPENLQPGDSLELFIYSDSEDRLIATTKRPLAMVGEIAHMKIADANNIGAFADWGLMKDLLIPFREQRSKLKKGQEVLIAVEYDFTTQRIFGSTKIEKYLDNVPPEYEEGQEVDLVIWNETDFGYKVIINQQHTGLLYKNQVFKPLNPGDAVKGYIQKVREDEKIDCMLTKSGFAKTEGLSDQILEALEVNGGTLNLSDKSSPEEIQQLFHCSKKAFKMAIGSLYKDKKITISPESISLTR
ncbi:S1 RNA-binding domain-containing protein [Saccharicrinis sp. FJH2]|uniref:CvfB family protein n=1 Tax=Saccharicrinis sp. FJH65 TaxID=3344659 RepID=UPI0035F37C12